MGAVNFFFNCKICGVAGPLGSSICLNHIFAVVCVLWMCQNLTSWIIVHNLTDSELLIL